MFYTDLKQGADVAKRTNCPRVMTPSITSRSLKIVTMPTRQRKIPIAPHNKPVFVEAQRKFSFFITLTDYAFCFEIRSPKMPCGRKRRIITSMV